LGLLLESRVLMRWVLTLVVLIIGRRLTILCG